MAEGFAPLDWLARRRDGESRALIASGEPGVSKNQVRVATEPYGPFPRPSRQLHRTYTPGAVLDEWAARWVDQRRRGVLAAEIARAEGVVHQIVGRVTKGHGPFPAVDVVEGWAEARHAGRTVSAIAAEAGVRPGVVRVATAPHGPFRAPGARLPESVESLNSIARRVGVASVTVLQWQRKGRLPRPDFVTARGRRVWLPATIDRWLEEGDLETCPDCGARCLSVRQHRPQAHGRG